MRPLTSGLRSIVRTFLIGTFFLCEVNLCVGQLLAKKEILLLHSYHQNYKWTDEITATVLDEFKDIIPDENIHVEYMDARRSLDDSLYSNYLHKFMFDKYQYRHFDLILVFDDYGLKFLYQYGDTLFPGVPIVHGGVNVFSKALLKTKKNIIGVYEGLAVKENLDLIYKIQPSVKKIVLLSDATNLGNGMEVAALNEASSWSHAQQVKVELQKVGDLDSLRIRLKNCLPDTAFLILSIHKDKYGRYFSYQQHLPELSKESKSPIYGMWGSLMLGNGCVGGYMNNTSYHAHEVSKIAKLILNGKNTASIHPPDRTRYFPVFDDRLIKRYEIDYALLPADAELQFVISDPWKKYKQYLITLSGILFITILIILYLYHQNRRMAHLNKELKRLNMQVSITNGDIEQLIHSLSHRVRLFACHIQGFVNIHNLGKKSFVTAEGEDEIMDGIGKASENLIKAIDDIVVIGSREKDTGEIPKQILLKDIVFSIRDSIKQTFANNDFALVYSEKEKIVFNYWESELYAVLKELMTNCIRFQFPENPLIIEINAARSEHNFITIEVKDNGLGMNLALYGNRVFRLFERFHLNISGNGTGLYLVKSILKWRSGDIKVTSEVRRGTMMSIALKSQ